MWPRIRFAGVDSGGILRFFSDQVLETESNICEKTEPDPESLFISAVAGVCVVFTNVIPYVKHY